MIILICIFWGSFIASFTDRADRLVVVLMRHSIQTESSYIRFYRMAWSSLVGDRSKCISCHQPIKFYDNLPLLSFIWLQGKCRSCGQKIPSYLWGVELLFLMLGILMYFGIKDLFFQCVSLVLVSLLYMIAVIDLRRKVIPDILTYSLFWVGLFWLIEGHRFSIIDGIITSVSAYLFLKSVQIIYLIFFKKLALGDADPLLGFAIGSWLTINLLPYFFLLSALITMAGIYFFRKKDSVLSVTYPYGPGLVIAGFLLLIFRYFFE